MEGVVCIVPGVDAVVAEGVTPIALGPDAAAVGGRGRWVGRGRRWWVPCID